MSARTARADAASSPSRAGPGQPTPADARRAETDRDVTEPGAPVYLAASARSAGDGRDRPRAAAAGHARPDPAIHDPGEPAATGERLPAFLRLSMERCLDADFSGVRFRYERQPPGVIASTTSNQVVLAPGLPRPDSPLVRPLLAHELAHVAQRQRAGAPAPVAALESEARRAAAASARADATAIVRHASARQTLHSKLSDELDADWAAHGAKARIFDLLRKGGGGGDADARNAIRSMFADGSDDRWLAEAILDNGPEPLWPTALIGERVRRARAGNWAPEPGDIEATLSDPAAASGAPTVRAFFFPGLSARRAMVIGGIHGTEQQAADTVEMLRTELHRRSAAGSPPFFTTILVPTLFESTHRGGRDAGKRHVRGGMGRTRAGALERSRRIEPNRNFPLPGEDLAAARARGSASATAPELVFRDGSGTIREAQDTARQGGTSIRMLTENRILIALIERFQPERLASIHAHSLKTTIGDAPGIFVDPRGIDPATKTVTNAGQVAADDRLASAMVVEGTRRWRSAGGKVPGVRGRGADPFVGNAPGTADASVRYLSAATPEGNSLGTWAPVPTVAGTAGAAVTRPGITTVTVELPQWTDPSQAGALRRIQELDRDLLVEIFLGDPSTAVPATTATTPSTVP